jgi:GT2 family glycosyltransferase
MRGNERLLRLAALLARSTTRPQVVVADNGLDPRVSGALRSTGVDVATMDGNCGFAAAVNRAARLADGDVLVIVNDDVLPVPGGDFLAELVAPVAEGHGMVAAVLVKPSLPGVVESAGFEVDDALNAHHYLRGLPIEDIAHAPGPPLGPCGGAAAYRRDVFLGAGGFDEGFFAYWEDVDLAIRLHALGVTCGLAAGARGLHNESTTLGAGSLTKAIAVGKSRGYFLRKYDAFGTPRVAMRVVPMEVAVSCALAMRHRSLKPALARVAGWRACGGRAAWPTTLRPTVGFVDGARRRYARGVAT